MLKRNQVKFYVDEKNKTVVCRLERGKYGNQWFYAIKHLVTKENVENECGLKFAESMGSKALDVPNSSLVGHKIAPMSLVLTESTLKSSLLKNIKAMAGVFGIESNVPVKVVDCTGERKEVVDCIQQDMQGNNARAVCEIYKAD